MAWFLAGLAISLIIFVIYVNIASNSIKITNVKIESKKLPQSFDGYKIAFMSDLHDKTFGADNAPLIEKIKELNPDIIVFGGDMHESDAKDDDVFLHLVKSLSEIAPIYSVEGNHDAYYHLRDDYVRYMKKLSACGLINLTSSVFLTNGKASEKIVLTGQSYHEYREGEIRFDDSYFNILTLHDPFAFDDFEKKADLMLSGHVHGGVLQLPFIGAVFSPGSGAKFFERFQSKYFFPKYYKGIYSKDNGKLAVTVGLGNVKFMSFRILRPEIMLITLNCKE